MNRLRRERRGILAAGPRELAGLNRRSKEVLERLLQGFRDEPWKVELAHIEQRRAELEVVIASGEDEPSLPALHPHMAETFADKTRQLAGALEHPNEESRAAARQSLGDFIEQIVIPPGDELLKSGGRLRKMLTAAGRTDAAAVGQDGCGGGRATWATGSVEVVA